MRNIEGRPKIGLLALTLELYETLAPGLRASREAWLRRELLPELEKACEVRFERAVYGREDIETTVSGFVRNNFVPRLLRYILKPDHVQSES